MQDLVAKHAQVIIDYEAKSDLSCDFEPVLMATRQLRMLLSIERAPPIQEVVNSGVPPVLIRLISLLYDTQHEFVFEATWALTNVCSGTRAQMSNLMENAGLLEIMIHVMQHPNAGAMEQAVWCLGNIAGDNYEYRDLVIQADFALDRILGLFSTQMKISTCRMLTWLVSNLCRGRPQPRFEAVSRFLPTLAQLFHEIKDDEVIADALWAFSNLSDGHNSNIQAVIESGVLDQVFSAVNNMELPQGARMAALRTMGNLTTGTDAQTQIAVNLGAVNVLHKVLTTQAKKESMLKDAMWAFSNIAAGTTDQVGAILECDGLVPLIIDIACYSDHIGLVKEAMYTLSNMTTANVYMVAKLFQQCPNMLCAFLYGLKYHQTLINEVAYSGIVNLIDKVRMEELFNCITKEMFDLALLNDNTRGDSLFVGLAANPTYASNVDIVNMLIWMNVDPSVPSLHSPLKTGYRFVIEEYNAIEYCERFQQVKVLTLFCAMQTVPRLKHSVVKLPMELWRMLQTMLFVTGPIYIEDFN